MNRLAIVAFSNISRDPRVLRQISFLSTKFQVITIGYGPKPDRSSKHIEIPRRLGYLPLRPVALVSLIFRNYERVLRVIPTADFVREQLTQLAPDAILANDVLTLSPCIESGFPVVADMHEYAPREMEEDWRFRVLLQTLYVYICRTRLPLCRAIFTVSDGLAREYEHEFKVSVSVVRNIREVPSTSWHPLKLDTELPVRLVHTGLAARARKLERLIMAVGESTQLQMDLYLVPAPRQRRYFRRLKTIIKKYSNVRLLNPVEPEKLPETIAMYDAGALVIYPSSFSLQHCLPNKLFDCIAANRPVVVGPSPDLAQFVTTHGIGVVTRSFSVEDIREALLSLKQLDLNSFSRSAHELQKQLKLSTELQPVASALGDIC
jgi:glycosyltransferase involved in cell wall biosynthesis